jgi:hypothetical protein
MSELLKHVLAAHGSMEQWRSYREVRDLNLALLGITGSQSLKVQCQNRCDRKIIQSGVGARRFNEMFPGQVSIFV